ncbi:cell division protein FtsX [Firmicutes bacterium CAG:460]|nr:cell division protein FtsX [Firmicutes bacterium CAG:460]
MIMRKEVIRQMRAFRIFFRSIRDALKSVVRNFSLSFASIMCTTITLILVAVAVVAAANVNNATRLIEDELTIVTYLKKDVTEEQIENIKSEISSYKNIEEVTFKSKDEWKLEMSEYDDSFKTVLNYLDENPLMDSFVLKVNDVKKLSETSEYIKAINGVDTVKYGEGMVEQVISVFDIVQKIVVVVVIALIVVTSFLISNTIKLTIFSRRNEIEIMRLVGASNITIKLPFLFEGFIIGLIGSIIPVCITIYGYVILYSRLHGKLFSNMIMLIKPYPFVFWVSLIVIAIGALVGMYGSIKAVRKYLKV